MMEFWKDIPGIENYQASTIGNIRNSKTGRLMKLHEHYSRNEKLYLRVILPRKKSKKKGLHHRVHRLIALTFIGPPPFEKAQVAHTDDDGTNNHVSNLSYKTNTENQYEKKCANCPHGKIDHHPENRVCFVEGCMCQGYKVKLKEKVTPHVYGQ